VRRGATALLVILLGVALVFWIMTRSWYIRGRLEPMLSRAWGAEVNIGRAQYEGDARFILFDVEVRAPGIAGPAADLMKVSRVSAQLEEEALYRGTVELRAVTLHDVRLRVSEDREKPGAFNFDALNPAASAEEAPVLPAIEVRNVRVETGTHHEGTFEPRGVRAFSGSLEALPGQSGVFRVGLEELGEDGAALGEQGMHVEGVISTSGGDHDLKLFSLDFDQRALDMCPQFVREWWNRMNLEGRITSLRSTWSEKHGYELTITLRDVGLTVPVDMSAFWVRYAEGRMEPVRVGPRLTVREGEIRIGDDHVYLENLRGAIAGAEGSAAGVPVPFDLTLRLDELAAAPWGGSADWIDQVLATAPLELAVRTDDLQVRRGADGTIPQIELPLAVGRVLERFSLNEWSLSTRVRAWRDPATVENGRLIPGELHTEGEAVVRDASGVYKPFAYPLDRVQADLEFDDDWVRVKEVRGVSASGGSIRLGGRVSAKRDGPYELALKGESIALDDLFRSALSSAEREVFDALFDRLAASDLRVPVGGVLDLDLMLRSATSSGEGIRFSGRIDVRGIDVVYENFPYPLHIDKGTLLWTDEGLFIAPAEGLVVHTPGGGQGRLKGGLRADGGGRLVPDATLSIENEAFHPLLVAALARMAQTSMSQDEEHARRLAGVLRGGSIDALLQFTAASEGGAATAYDAVMTLEDGELDLGPVVALAAIDPAPLADALVLRSCSARIELNPRRVLLADLTGRSARFGAVRATAELDRVDGHQARAEVTVPEIILGEDLLAFAPAGDASTLRQHWNEFRPEGSVMASLVLGRDEEGARWEISLIPGRLDFMADGEPWRMSPGGGRWIIDSSGRLRADDLAMELIDLSSGVSSRTGLRGTIGLRGDGPIDLSGHWHGARWRGGVARQIRSFIDGDGAKEDALTALGDAEFDLDFSLSRTFGDERLHHDLTLAPSRLWLDMDADTPVVLEIDEGSAVHLRDGAAEIRSVSGRGVSTAFAISGSASLGPEPSFDLLLDLEGRLGGREVGSFLPVPVREVLHAIDLQEGLPSRIRSAHLFAAHRTGGWEIEFGAQVAVEQASLRAGVIIEDLRGSFDLMARYQPGASPEVRLVTAFDEARVLGQRLTHVHGTFDLDERGERVRLRDGRAHAGPGLVTVEGSLGIGAPRDYRAALRLADVPTEAFELARPIREGQTTDDGPAPWKLPAGRLFAAIDLAGSLDAPQERTGRGSARVLGSDIAEIPISMRIAQLLQFSWPTSGFDYFESDFSIASDRLILERGLLESTVGDTVAAEIQGRGEVSLTTGALDLHVQSRAGIAPLRDVLGSLGDSLAAIRVRGFADQPEVYIESFPDRRSARRPIMARPHRREDATVAQEQRSDE